MTTSVANVFLAPLDVARVFYSSVNGDDTVQLARQYFNLYTRKAPIPVFNKTGVDVAEEVFDLTNNPSREDERAALYGQCRSFSVGDIVEVNGTRYLCLSMGWTVL